CARLGITTVGYWYFDVW
nr:immunoglobulin heavy chain junction region [Mus musculus]